MTLIIITNNISMKDDILFSESLIKLSRSTIIKNRLNTAK